MNRLVRENIKRAREAKRGDRGVRRAPSQIVNGELILGEILPTKQNVLDLTIEGLVKAATYVPRQILSGGSGKMQPPTPSGVEPPTPSGAEQVGDSDSKNKSITDIFPIPRSESSEDNPYANLYSWDGVSEPVKPDANDYKTGHNKRHPQYNIDISQYNKDIYAFRQIEKKQKQEQEKIDKANLADAWDRLNAATQGMSRYSDEFKIAAADAWVAEGGQLDNMGNPKGMLNGRYFYQYKVTMDFNPFR